MTCVSTVATQKAAKALVSFEIMIGYRCRSIVYRLELASSDSACCRRSIAW